MAPGAATGGAGKAPLLVFLHIHKTAGTSFRYILENTFSLSHCHSTHLDHPVFTPEDLAWTRRVFPSLRSIAGHNLVDPIATFGSDAFHMTILREPIARVFSHYQDFVVRGRNSMTFPEALDKKDFLSDRHVRRMAGGPDLDKAKKYLEQCGFVGLTEKFDLSLAVLKHACPVPINVAYRRLLVARDNSIKKSLEKDPAMVALARERNQLDLALYDFAVREVFPRACERAGLSPDAKVPAVNTASELSPRFVIGRIYNRVVFRQLAKLRR